LDPDPKLGGKWDPDPKKIVRDPQHWFSYPIISQDERCYVTTKACQGTKHGLGTLIPNKNSVFDSMSLKW
jgi:hypothetical protein